MEEEKIPTPTTPVTPVLDSAMQTGPDDEPEMTVGDKHRGEAPPDTDGDGRLSPTEAEKLLGGNPRDTEDGSTTDTRERGN